MPSSYTTEIAIEKQAAGENLNTWGDPKLGYALTRLTKAIAGWLTIALTANLTLSSSNSSTVTTDYQAYHALLKFTGTGPYTVTIPPLSKSFSIFNAMTDTLTITTGAGTTASIVAGETAAVICDGSNVYKVKVTDYGSSRITSVADPTGAQDVATKAYADALAFTANAGILPAQTGNSGKFITTNGTTASWGSVASTSLSDITAYTAARTALSVAFAVAL